MKGAQGQLPYETVGLFFEEWQLFEMAAKLIPIGVANGWEYTTGKYLIVVLPWVSFHRLQIVSWIRASYTWSYTTVFFIRIT